MTTFDSEFLRRVAASIRDTNYGPEVKSLAEAEADRIDAKADELEALERLAVDIGGVATGASEGVACGSEPTKPAEEVGNWGFGGGAIVFAPGVKGKTREELLSEKVGQLQAQVKHLSRVAVNAAEHGIPAPVEPTAVEVDSRAESQAACLYAKLLVAGEDPGIIFQAVLWAYEKVKSNPEIIWLEDLYQAWESRASAEATVNSTLKVPAPAVPAETGPWQRIEDVPETVGRLTDRDGDLWEWDGDNWVTPETAILPTTYINKHYAPFVAAPTGTGPWQTVDFIPEGVTRIKDCEGDEWHRCIDGWEHGGMHDPEGYGPFVAAKDES